MNDEIRFFLRHDGAGAWWIAVSVSTGVEGVGLTPDDAGRVLVQTQLLLAAEKGGDDAE